MKFSIITLVMFLYCLVAVGQQRLGLFEQRQLDSIATQDVPPNAPGIATAIIQKGKLVYKKYAGYADLTDSLPINDRTRFNIASNGKQFTALAILILSDNRKINLSDDIRKFLPTLFPGIKEKISIQSLLNHTSGIRDCYDLWSLQGITWWEQSYSNLDVLGLIEKQEDLNFKPNSAYLYSNTNYILLALIIEKVTGKSFVAFTNSMFKKLNMPNTSFENNYKKIKGPVAQAYFNFGTWTTYHWIWNVCGDGNLFSTLEDQVQWERIIQGSVTTAIKSSLIATSQQPISGSVSRNYGYGLEFSKYKGIDYVFHEGATGAWKATVIRFPGKKISMITLTNTGKSIPSTQTRQMADVLLQLQPDANYLVTRPSAIGKFISDTEIAGTYLAANDFAFQFEKQDNKVFLKRVGRNDVELEREADNIFHQKYDTAFKQEFTIGKQGALQVTAYYIDHSPYTLTKQNGDFSNVDFHQLEGKYTNTETGTTAEIGYKENRQYDIKIGLNDRATGSLVTPQKLVVDNYVISVDEMNPDNKTFYLNGGRIKHIRFQKL